MILFSDRYAWANSADPDQTDQGLHCLPFRLHHLHNSMVEAHSSNVRLIITHCLGVRIFRKFAVINEQPSYVYESQQNLGRGLWPRKNRFKPDRVIYYCCSKAVLLLWFILAVGVHPLSVCH